MEKHQQEKAVLGIHVRCHPIAYLRQRLRQQGFHDSRSIRGLLDGASIKVAGILIRPHRLPTKSGKTIVFFSLEDEYGLVDVTIFENTYQQYGQELFGVGEVILVVEGIIQASGMG